MKKITVFTLMLMLFASIGFSQTTVSYDFADAEAATGLNEVSPGITIDANIGFGSFKNGGTANPALNSGRLRLYQNATKGGSIKIYASNGVTISQVIVHAADRTGPAAYTVDGGAETELMGGATYTMSGISATSVVEFYQKDASSSNRIYVDDFEVIYTTGGGSATPAPVLTPGTGNYTTTQNVTMAIEADDKIGYDIYYTLDGTVPTDASTLYTVGVDISETTTLKAITYLGMDASNVTTGVYTFPVLPTEVATIAELRSMLSPGKDATVYTLTGEAFLTYQQDFKKMKYVQDATAGIEIYDNDGLITSTYAIKDGIKGLTGTLSINNGMMRLTATADPGAAFSNNNTIVPIELSVTEFNAALALNESMLVTVMAAHFDGADVGNNFATGTNYDISNNDIDLAVFRTQFYDASYIGMPIPAENQDITGIMLQYNGTPQIAAREMADITASPIPPVPVSSKGIIIAGLLIGLVVVVRRGRLF